MNTKIISLIWALALFSKGSPFTLASSAADFIAQESHERSIKNIEEKKKDIEKIKKELLKVHYDKKRKECFNQIFKKNPKYGAGILAKGWQGRCKGKMGVIER